MSIAALIRKNGLASVATATSATSATQPHAAADSVARIATVAVANRPSDFSPIVSGDAANDDARFRRWRISDANGESTTVLFTSPVTQAEVSRLYGDADIDPMPERYRGGLRRPRPPR
jgi:hypothetical protein